MPTEVGEFNDHRTITSPVTIEGALTAGATVQAGGKLIVDGAVGGDLIVEADGYVEIHGAFSGMLSNLGGIAVIAGFMTGTVTENHGVTALVAGTLIKVNGEHRQLNPDGTLTLIQPAQRVDIHMTPGKYLVLTEDGRYEPLHTEPLP